jgi:hypothetical protein
MRRKVVNKVKGAGGFNVVLSCGHKAWVAFGQPCKSVDCKQCGVR